MVYNREVTALRDVNFIIKEPGIIGLLGPNGAGKTTLCEIIVTSLKQTSGKCFVYGKDTLIHPQEVRKIIGYSPQDYIMDWDINVEDNLEIFAKIYLLSHWKNKVENLLKKFGLWEKRKRKAIELSGGEIRRVQLIRALLKEPKILIVDEPMLGMDPLGKERAMELFFELKDKGTTILLSTNEMHEVEDMCDFIIFINKGKIIAHGNYKEFMESFRNCMLIVIEYEGNLSTESKSHLKKNYDILPHKEGRIKIRVNKNEVNLKIKEIMENLSKDENFKIREIKVESPSLREVYAYLILNDENNNI
ncbi:MAG: ABC transporter ATP-binding protein [candidate division WOR-3 bacterium]